MQTGETTPTRAHEEYRQLRATIRERGTARVWIALVGLMAWGALATILFVSAPIAVGGLVPLVVLAAAFEAVFALHTAVERIGRYLQVFVEGDWGGTSPAPRPDAGWETAAMAFGQRFPGGGLDPLFSAHFALAAGVNVLLAAWADAPVRGELLLVGLGHALFGARVLKARRQAAAQRQRDLERFRELRARV